MNTITEKGKRSKPIARKYAPSRWWERENKPYAADNKIRDEYADWIKLVDWQLFGTLTFAWRINDERKLSMFDEFINRLERAVRSDLAYVRGDEKKISGCGKPPCGLHFHVLLTSVANLEPAFVESLWMSLAGSGNDDAGARVEAYSPNLRGVEYALKFVNKPEGNWSFRNLHLFHPQLSLQHLAPRQRRNLRRHKARLSDFATV
jgi:hypothetical protein